MAPRRRDAPAPDVDRPTAGRLARGLAARGARAADDFALAFLAWSERTGTERVAFSLEKRLSGLAAAVFGRWAVLGALGGEEVSPGVRCLTFAARASEDGTVRELSVEMVRGRGDAADGLIWSVLTVPAGVAGPNPAEAGVAVADRPDAAQALIDYWGEPRGDA